LAGNNYVFSDYCLAGNGIGVEVECSGVNNDWLQGTGMTPDDLVDEIPKVCSDSNIIDNPSPGEDTSNCTDYSVRL
jgi:hypothetical protein